MMVISWILLKLEGLEIPDTFHFGARSACAGFTVSGSVDQSNGSFLDGTQTGTCAGMHLISDLLLSFTHREMELHGSLCMCQWCFSISAAESEWHLVYDRAVACSSLKNIDHIHRKKASQNPIIGALCTSKRIQLGIKLPQVEDYNKHDRGERRDQVSAVVLLHAFCSCCLT
ncbi:unnamed protein product [Musa acuminata subsp. burmannicoides]